MTKSLPPHCLQIPHDQKSSRTTESPLTLDGSDLRPQVTLHQTPDGQIPIVTR